MNMLYILMATMALCLVVLAIAVFRLMKQSDQSATTCKDPYLQSVAVLNKSVERLQSQMDDYIHRNTDVLARNAQVIQDIQKRVWAMNDVMVDKKSRGSWGEYQLEYLLKVYFGSSSEIWESQYRLGSNAIVDVALHMPDSSQVLCIDSKFPLEAYNAMLAAEASHNKTQLAHAERYFVRDVKNHIDAIATKYAQASESVGEAVMFIPSEAVYVEILSNAPELLDHALASHVMLASPTTLVALVGTLVSSIKDYRRMKNMEQLVVLFDQVGQDAKRLEERAGQFALRLRQGTEEAEKVSISARKIAQNCRRLQAGQAWIEQDGSLR